MPTLRRALLALLLLAGTSQAAIIDAPHDPVHGVRCGDCHSYSLWWRPDAATAKGTAAAIEALCRRCHPVVGPDEGRGSGCGHSWQTMGANHNPKFGAWQTSCCDCHDPHRQAQLDWANEFPQELFLATGSIKAEGLLRTDGYRSLVACSLPPGPSEWGLAGHGPIMAVWREEGGYDTYRVLSLSSQGLELRGTYEPNSRPRKFGLIQGQFLKSRIRDRAGQPQPVKFFPLPATTTSSPGLCQVCHAETSASAAASGNQHYPTLPCSSCHLAALGFRPARQIWVQPGTTTRFTLASWRSTPSQSYTLLSGPAFGRLEGSPPNLSYSTGTTFPGRDFFVYKIVDQEGGEETVAVLLLRAPANALPQSEEPPPPAAEGPPELQLAANPSQITPGESALLAWQSVRAGQGFFDQEMGSVATAGSLTVSPAATTTYTLTVTGPQGSVQKQVTVFVRGAPSPLPADSFAKSQEALIPADATIAAYNPDRFALLAGEAAAEDGTPLPGVKLTVVAHPEYGSAWTDDNGRFILPVEGGVTHTLDYVKEGFLPLQRQAAVGWNQTSRLAPVRLLRPDPVATTIAFNGDPNTVFVHQAPPIPTPEAASTPGATVVLKGNTKAHALDENGQSKQSLPTVTIRATAIPMPAAMPAELPPTSAFTYCANFQVDGVKKAEFDHPATIWLKNFLGFAVGEAVPVGYYNPEKAVWEPMPNGVVAALLDRDDDGLIDALDSDGDGQANDLNHDGHYEDEVVGINEAAAYQPGDTVWRVMSNHFSTLDFNWPFRFPPDAIPPNPLGQPLQDQDNRYPPSCNQVNSYVDHRGQVYHKDLAIPGSELLLHYASDQTAGYRARLTVPASGAWLPPSLIEIKAILTVAGRKYEQSLPPLPNQQAEFTWDWTDHLGNPVSGQVTAKVELGFVYRGVYASLAGGVFLSGSQAGEGGTATGGMGQVGGGMAFGQPGTQTTGVVSRQEIIVWRTHQIPLHKANTPAASPLAEGWRLANVHWLANANPPTLMRGDGTTISYPNIISTVAGNGLDGLQGAGDGGPASAARMRAPNDVAVDGQGELYVVDGGANEVRKIDGQGIISTVAGDHSRLSGYTGDGILATESRLSSPRALAFDPAGNLYIADTYNHRIRKVDKDGLITTVAGTGQRGYNGDQLPATGAMLNTPSGLALDSHGNLYIADTENNRIRKVDATGIITTLAGDGSYGFAGDGGPGLRAKFKFPFRLALDRTGNLFVADRNNHRIRKIAPTGLVTTIAGNGSQQAGDFTDNVPALQTSLLFPNGVTVDESGNVYVSDTLRQRIRKIDLAGIVSTIAGNGSDAIYDQLDNGDGGSPTEASLGYAGGLAIDPRGRFYLADPNNHVVRQITPPYLSLSGMSDAEVALADTDGVAHLFSRHGRHLRSLDPATGVVLQSLEYDEHDQLTAIRDRFNQATVIERDRGGQPAALVAANGLRTMLTIDRANALTVLATPDSASHRFAYDAGGLLVSQIDPNGYRFANHYDEAGRLTAFVDQTTSHYQYRRQALEDGTALTTFTTGAGDTTSYKDLIDNNGNLLATITDPAGNVGTTTSDPAGLHTSRTLACGVSEDLLFGLDPLTGQKYAAGKRRTTPAGLADWWNRARTIHDSRDTGQIDLLLETTNHLGRIATRRHDLTAATLTTTSPLGRSTVAGYDPQTLLPLTLSRSGLFDQALAHDGEGHLVTLSVGDRQTRFAYDARGFLASRTDPEQRITSYERDPVGRITAITAPDGSRESFAYDANGNLAELQTPNNARHLFAYNDFNANSAYTAPLSGSTNYFYDADRRLTTVLFPSGLRLDTSYSQGRIARLVTPEGAIDFDYLCANKLGRIANRHATIAYDYDGPLPTRESITGLLNHTANFAYNHDFSLASASYAATTVEYGYDADGLLVQVGAFIVARRPDNGFPVTVGDGVLTVNRDFNGHGELEGERTTVAGQVIAAWHGQRDRAGRLANKTSTIAGQMISHGYDYDPAGRLVAARRDGILVEEYHYIANNERSLENNTLRGIANQSFAYSAEDHLWNAGSVNYQFDVDGFLASRSSGGATTNYFYSSRGELSRVELADGRVIEYLYDPFQRRLAKMIDGTVVEKYLWQGATRLLALYDGQDRLRQRFEYGDGRLPLALTMDGQRYYLATDQNGTPLAVADQNGRVVKQLDYDSFGNLLADSNPGFTIPFGFAGGLQDEETGLLHFGYRDYDPALGRWVAKDPILFAGGDANLYGYVGNDPINWVDPDGLEVDYRGHIVEGPNIRDTLSAIDSALKGSGIKVTGGDRYRDNKGNIRSLTDDQIIPNSAKNSGHIGSRAVDFKASDFTPTDKFLKYYFDYVNRDYPDGHIHGELRNSGSCYEK